MRILLVEDDPQLSRSVSEALAGAGWTVDHTADGEDAWFRGDTEEYAAVVLDLGLPGLDGLTVLRRWTHFRAALRWSLDRARGLPVGERPEPTFMPFGPLIAIAVPVALNTGWLEFFG